MSPTAEKDAHIPDAINQKAGATKAPSEGGPILRAYTLLHVMISLIGIATGFIVIGGMITSNPLPGWTAVFLWTTIATSVTGFFFPFKGFKPAYVVGAISLVLLALAYRGLYTHQLAGSWRWIYVVTAVMSQYLNVFVLVVQSFQKIPALHALAPTQSEPPFKKAQLALLFLFIVLGTLAVRNF
jgi:hypothetical protein